MPAINVNTSKRDDLVGIASDLFYRQRYGATGIKQIIDTAGIAKGSRSTYAGMELEPDRVELTNKVPSATRWKRSERL